MTLVAAAVCPHPPLLVPEVARGEPVAVREPAAEVTRRLVAYDPDLVVVVGDAPRTGAFAAGESGTLAGFGVPLSVTLGRATDPSVHAPTPRRPTLPLSLTVGAWLLEQTSWAGKVTGFGVSATTAALAASEIGAELARCADRVGLLVMGDGSARRTVGAPGGFDARAQAHDDTVVAALSGGDVAALGQLDPGHSRELMAAGRASWQVLAGASRPSSTQDDLHIRSDTHMQSLRSHVEYVDAPYGVGYVVAFWEWGSP
ncbi:class III extradiol dioxygenase subunit B-like domain-containing protein [Frankia sp. Cppng1_Ct_nod]|uniref:class III extradiol dioxygenase subunit B-like domain-containing protein n=1 Tax=Frankia sp. Cppng1_Ct_nod TaxID=2897162 RepID=UPI001041A116|nr:class III extradiol dioxygenase subunit B-like domain-containing protein [Frankia sp. Cppng1_Ct_nod]